MIINRKLGPLREFFGFFLLICWPQYIVFKAEGKWIKII